MRTKAFLVAMALVAAPSMPVSAQQEAPATAPQDGAPAPSPPPTTPDASMPAAAAAGDMTGNGGGPAYGELEQLRSLVQQQHDYISQLESHIRALDAYITRIRGGGR